MINRNQLRLIILSSLGGILEFYDFIIYALFAPYFANIYFPAKNSTVSLIITYIMFSVGYLVRPIGGILFGHFGDTRGRKKTFGASILMMALATIIIGCTPSYASIGMLAPLIICGARIVQGLSLGGEIPGAIAYVSESMPEMKSFACGIMFCGLLSGILLGSFAQSVLLSTTTNEQMALWGWRLPFIFGGIMGLFSYALRKKISESQMFITLTGPKINLPIKEVIVKDWRNVLGGILLVALQATNVSLLLLFMPTYFQKILNVPPQLIEWQHTLIVGVSALFCAVFGYLADKMDNKRLILFACLLSLAGALPIFYIYQYSIPLLLIGGAISAILNGISSGIIPGYLSLLFPTQIRYSGIAFVYNAGFALFAGLTPVISLLLISYTGHKIAPAYYLMIVALLSLISLKLTKSRALNEG